MKVIVSSFFKILFVVLLATSFTSCATIFSGTKADIFIDGDVDEPVTISSSAGEYKDVTLPTMVEVKRRQLDGQHIQISSEHHAFDDIVLQKDFNGWSIVSAVMDVVPLCVDLMTNAVSKPKFDQFYITPIENLSADDSLRKNGSIPITTLNHDTRAQLRSQQLSVKYPRHEINGTLGLGPNQADRSTHRFVDGLRQPYHLEKEGECFDLIGDSYVIGKLEYHYRLNRKWDIGAMIAWGYSKENYTDDEYYYAVEQNKLDNRDTYTIGYQKCRTFSFAPSVRYTWYETPTYRLFSRVSLGMMRHHLNFSVEEWKYNGPTKPYHSIVNEGITDKTEWRMAYQFSPIGISVGSSNFRFFCELGYGCLGVMNTGVSVCF